MPSCSTCGTNNADSTVFCVKCGHSLSSRTSSFVSFEYGSFWLRLVGFIIDVVLVGAIAAIASFVLGNPGAGITFLVGLVYIVGLNANGGTLGKRAVGLRLEDATTSDDIGYRAAFIRYIVAIASAVVLFLGYFWVIWDEKNQTWHDKAAGSVVVVSKPRSAAHDMNALKHAKQQRHENNWRPGGRT